MKNSLKIIGLGGTNGSGKDTVGEILAKKHNFWFFSFTDLLRQECRARNIPVIRENLRQISAEWRREFGLGVLVDRSMEEFKKLGGFNEYSGIVVSSLRNPYESSRIHELGGKNIWVDANLETRYERIQKNAQNRSRASEDKITFEEFKQHEEDEMHPPANAGQEALSVADVKKQSDIFIDNNSTLNNLEDQLKKKLILTA